MPQTTNRLAWFRNAEGLSLRELAAKLAPVKDGGLPPDPATIRRWELGISGIPDHRKLELAEIFGISVSYLMGWEADGDNGNGEHVRHVA